MKENAKMNALMNETLNISGVMLVKLFGRTDDENARFDRRAASVRDAGVQQAMTGSMFFAFLGLIGAAGTAIVYYVGGRLVLDDVFTVGTIVAFAALLTQLYAPLQALVNAPVDFVTSMTSFERVFEVLDIPVDIEEKPDAIAPETIDGQVAFNSVFFRYDSGEDNPLSHVERANRSDSIDRVMSDDDDTKKPSSNGKKAKRKQSYR